MIVFRNLNPIEVNEGDNQIIIEIDPSASGITEITSLQISTIEGSAVSTSFDEEEAGVDFDAIPSSIVIVNPEDPETLTFTIDITDDAIAESEENFQFQVTAVEDESLNGTANIIIVDNDSTDEPEIEVDGLLPEISITDLEQLEGDNGNTNFEFTVGLSQASDELITVDYATANGTAEVEDILEDTVLIDAADYIATNGVLEFEPGSTEKTITVEVLTDNFSLPNEAPEETFFINLDNATNADFNNFIATGTILDDDLEDTVNSTLPVLSLEDQTFTEADLGEDTTQQLTVNLIDANGEAFIATEDITFTYSTEDITAVANADYEFVDSQTATILQGQSTTTIPLSILGDDIIEADETFSVNLSDLDFSLAEFDNDAIAITIEDNDGFTDEEPEPEENLDFNDMSLSIRQNQLNCSSRR